MAREAWTDERLDDLKEGMHREFDQAQRQFDLVHSETRELRAHTDAGFKALNARFDARFDVLEARFDALNRTIIVSMASIVVTLLGAILTNSLS